jgi:hypothetical protein
MSGLRFDACDSHAGGGDSGATAPSGTGRSSTCRASGRAGGSARPARPNARPAGRRPGSSIRTDSDQRFVSSTCKSSRSAGICVCLFYDNHNSAWRPIDLAERVAGAAWRDAGPAAGIAVGNFQRGADLTGRSIV